VYADLLAMIRKTGKRWYVITTNADHQFVRAGFDEKKVLTPQGNYAYFQCGGANPRSMQTESNSFLGAKPCTRDIWENRALLEKMVKNMDRVRLAVRTEDLPGCPRCGELAVMNLRGGEHFVEEPYMKKWPEYEAFVRSTAGERLVLIEMGVGFNTPGIIRYPFEHIARENPRAVLVRMNRDRPEVPADLGARGISLGGDLARHLAYLSEHA
jgi:NAD-dependent SIR2 family protein deacetylase